MISFALVDLTTQATAQKPSQEILESFILAWMQQIEDDFGPAYGAPACEFRIAKGPTDRASSEIAVNLRDALPDVPGALAYHATTNGVPDIEVACSLTTSLYDPGDSLSAVISHEILELLGDIGANLWADKQDGSGQTEAREACDVVQNTTYGKANGVHVSNFVLPAYFTPGAGRSWDFMNVMTGPTDISHGYAIRATAPTDAHDVEGKLARRRSGVFLVGELTEMQRKRKASPWSRTSRRGAKP